MYEVSSKLYEQPVNQLPFCLDSLKKTNDKAAYSPPCYLAGGGQIISYQKWVFGRNKKGKKGEGKKISFYSAAFEITLRRPAVSVDEVFSRLFFWTDGSNQEHLSCGGFLKQAKGPVYLQTPD